MPLRRQGTPWIFTPSHPSMENSGSLPWLQVSGHRSVVSATSGPLVPNSHPLVTTQSLTSHLHRVYSSTARHSRALISHGKARGFSWKMGRSQGSQPSTPSRINSHPVVFIIWEISSCRAHLHQEHPNPHLEI